MVNKTVVDCIWEASRTGINHEEGGAWILGTREVCNRYSGPWVEQQSWFWETADMWQHSSAIFFFSSSLHLLQRGGREEDYRMRWVGIMSWEEKHPSICWNHHDGLSREVSVISCVWWITASSLLIRWSSVVNFSKNLGQCDYDIQAT